MESEKLSTQGLPATSDRDSELHELELPRRYFWCWSVASLCLIVLPQDCLIVALCSLVLVHNTDCRTQLVNPQIGAHLLSVN